MVLHLRLVLGWVVREDLEEEVLEDAEDLDMAEVQEAQEVLEDQGEVEVLADLEEEVVVEEEDPEEAVLDMEEALEVQVVLEDLEEGLVTGWVL